jgi:hypothetical protein
MAEERHRLGASPRSATMACATRLAMNVELRVRHSAGGGADGEPIAVRRHHLLEPVWERVLDVRVR